MTDELGPPCPLIFHQQPGLIPFKTRWRGREAVLQKFSTQIIKKKVLPVYQCCGIVLLWCNAVYISPRFGWKPDFYTDGSSGGCSGSAMDCGHASGMPQQNIGLTPLRRKFVFCVCPTQKKINPASSGFPRLTVVKSTQDLCKQFYYQSLLFFNQFALQ